jgi:hypothetical protein
MRNGRRGDQTQAAPAELMAQQTMAVKRAAVRCGVDLDIRDGTFNLKQ